jgi:hypothetical protein
MPILVVGMAALLVVSIVTSSVLRRLQTPPTIRHGLAVLTIVLVSVPASVLFTLLLMPLWRWLEQNFGIESVGHSGPAEWCFGAMFVACVVALGSLYAFRVRSGSAAADKGV